MICEVTNLVWDVEIVDPSLPTTAMIFLDQDDVDDVQASCVKALEKMYHNRVLSCNIEVIDGNLFD